MTRRLGAILLAAGLLATGACSRPPAKPADYVDAFTSIEPHGATHLDPGRARLTGPHFDVAFTLAEHGTEITLNGQTLRAAAGHELLVLFSDGKAAGEDPYSRAAGLSERPFVSVRIDGVSRLVRLPAPWPGVIVASVPRSHDAQLQIEDAGRTQTLSMRSGERGSDAIVGYYPQRRLSWSPADVHSEGAATFRAAHISVTVAVSLNGTEVPRAYASLEPYVSGAGWAPAGHVWLDLYRLHVQSKATLDNPAAIEDPVVGNTVGLPRYPVDLRQCLLLTQSGGSIPPSSVADATLGGGRSPLNGTNFDAEVAFPVSDTFTGGTLEVHPPATPLNDRQAPIPVTWTSRPAVGKIQLTIVR